MFNHNLRWCHHSHQTSKISNSPLGHNYMYWSLKNIIANKREVLDASIFTVLYCTQSFFSSFFQSVCVLGYCVLPLAIALVICRLIIIKQPQTVGLFAARSVVVLAGFGWATFGNFMQFSLVNNILFAMES